MRQLLKELGLHQRYVFQATVAGFGSKNIRGQKQATIILTKVNQNGKRVANHLWFETRKIFNNCKIGDVVEFEAEIDCYVKGYKGQNKKLFNTKPLAFDYQLSNPLNVHKIANANSNEVLKNE